MKQCYICGPMTGLPSFNFPAFHEADKNLTTLGWKCWNPAKMDIAADGIDRDGMSGHEEVPNLKEIARRDVDAIFQCEMIYMLRGWENSKGARAEHALANWIGLEIIYQ
mgnify:CR=1 FL=1|tara:strand:+ start:7112 stop:7438 length:327 start_codon:yes stop_codon:yes gene_type:complete